MTVSIDAETRLPLRFSITPKGADDPAAAIGFDTVSFDPIDPAMFAFTPPEGARVSDVTPPAAEPHHGMTIGSTQGDPFTRPGDVRTFGSGFSARVAIALSGPVPDQARALLPYAGPLFSAIVIQRDGGSWLLVGPVPVATLQRDADRLP